MKRERITRSKIERKYVETVLIDVQREIIKKGFDEVEAKKKESQGIEPHPEQIDTDEKPN